MQQLLEFASNNLLLVTAFVAVLALLAWTELGRSRQKFKELSPLEAVQFMNREESVVIDISTVAEFQAGHLLGARHIVPSRLKEPDAEVGKLLKRPILLVCKNGQGAQASAAALIKAGASEVAVLKGGLAQWRAENYPVTRS